MGYRLMSPFQGGANLASYAHALGFDLSPPWGSMAGVNSIGVSKIRARCEQNQYTPKSSAAITAPSKFSRISSIICASGSPKGSMW